MSELNMDWVKEQLTQNKTRKMTGDAVLELLAAWKNVKKPPKSDISKEVVELFSKLALGHALVKEDKNENWLAVQAGAIKVTDVVRVKFDAFDEASGKYSLNGRRGKVVGVRSGDIIMKSDDGKTPLLDGVHFRPENLEKLV
jgi:hypothetical protein